MAKVAITIDAATPDDYMARIERIKPFVSQLHIDLSDGVFTDQRTVSAAQAYGIDGIPTDVHLMLEHPLEVLETVMALLPELIVVHFECSDDLGAIHAQLKDTGIRFGLAMNSDTTVEQLGGMLGRIDHLLIYTGAHLGHNSSGGSEFRMDQLDKITAARKLNPELEIGLDGGINQSSVRACVEAGANILNVGSFIHNSQDPEMAYEAIRAIAEGDQS
jgi:ribulose-phosphate 3-epimerase